MKYIKKFEHKFGTEAPKFSVGDYVNVTRYYNEVFKVEDVYTNKNSDYMYDLESETDYLMYVQENRLSPAPDYDVDIIKYNL